MPEPAIVPLNVYTCTKFIGREGAPVAALIVARDQQSGARLLTDYLVIGGCGGSVEPQDLKLANLTMPP